MFKGVVLLAIDDLIYLIFDAVLSEDPIHLIEATVFSGHPIPALPVACGAEVDIVIYYMLSLTQGDALTPTNYL